MSRRYGINMRTMEIVTLPARRRAQKTYEFPMPNGNKMIAERVGSHWEWHEEEYGLKGRVVGGMTGICKTLKECKAEAGVN